jgi:hypothetical protein
MEVAGGQIGPGESVMYENGFIYLFVDAQCNYWVNDPSEAWNETRTGVLDAESALRIGERLHFGAWPQLAGTWSGVGVDDAPVSVFDHAHHTVFCAQLCDSDDVPDAVKEMRKGFPIVARELWVRGTGIVSSVRAIAVEVQRSPGVPFVDWPLSRPISDFVRTGYVGSGEGVLEDDPASVQILKELRASFVRGDHGTFFWNMLPVTSGGAYYRLYMRDTLPFEDERGLVPLSYDRD